MNKHSSCTDLELWLEADEMRSRPYRAGRLRELLDAIEISEGGMFFSGGIASGQAFNELRLAYIHGLYLSTVLLTLACVEHELAGRLYGAGWEKAKTARLEHLLDEGYNRGMLATNWRSSKSFVTSEIATPTIEGSIIRPRGFAGRLT